MAHPAPPDEAAVPVVGPANGARHPPPDLLALRASWLRRRYALPPDVALLIATLALGEVGRDLNDELPPW